MRQLLAAYEAAEGADAPAAAAGSNAGSSQRPPAVAAAVAAAAGGGGGDADAEAGASWAGEEYEPDAVQCMQRSYLKFMKRIARQPQQCARCEEERQVASTHAVDIPLCSPQADCWLCVGLRRVAQTSGSDELHTPAAALGTHCRYCHAGPLLWPKSSAPPPPSPCPLCGAPRVFELQLMPALSQMVLEAAGMLQEQELAVDAAVVNAVGNWDWCTVAVFTCRDSCGSGVAAEEVLLVTEAECEAAPKGAGGGGGTQQVSDDAGQEEEDEGKE